MTNLKEIRSQTSYTQEDVADMTGITRQYYNMIENGGRQPSVDLAKKIAAVLGFDWTRFYEDGKIRR